MILSLKADKNCQRFGFVETWKPYSYDTGAVTILAIANAGKYVAEPYIFRGGEFVEAETIENEMGINRYIKAKKPFYSLLGTGNLIVEMRICFDLKDRSYIPDKSKFVLYGVVKDSLSFDSVKGWTIKLKRITSVNDTVQEWLNSMGTQIASCGTYRDLFLKSRFGGNDTDETRGDN